MSFFGLGTTAPLAAQADAAANYSSPAQVAFRAAEAAGPTMKEKIAAAVAAHNATVAALNAGKTAEEAAEEGRLAGDKAAGMKGGRRNRNRSNRNRSRRNRNRNRSTRRS
jgi:hypothetical protein